MKVSKNPKFGNAGYFLKSRKKKAIKDLVSKRTTMKRLINEHQVGANTGYWWLYKYLPYYEQKCTLVVQMKSEGVKNQDLQARIAELERSVGEKQLEINFLNKLLKIGKKEVK